MIMILVDRVGRCAGKMWNLRGMCCSNIVLGLVGSEVPHLDSPESLHHPLSQSAQYVEMNEGWRGCQHQ